MSGTEKKRKKKILRIIIIIIVILILLVIGAIMFYKHVYGTFPIPNWMRPEHEPLKKVENYHSNLNFKDIPNSSLPRIDVVMAGDYLLSGSEYTKCTVEISNANEFNLEASSANIRIRGNSTSQADKKPYKLKFDEKKSLFGGGKEKSWVLLANVNDITGIHNYVSMEIYRYLTDGNAFIPMIRFVNLYINGEYQGVYNICDQVETGKTRVPISSKINGTPEETDYLVLSDKYTYYEGNAGEEGIGWFWLDKSMTAIEVKSPDTDDERYTKEYTDYIKSRMDSIYDVILSKDWKAIQQVIDIDAIVNGFLVSIIANNEDIAYKSIYFYLPAGGKLIYGPVWDMDLTFGAGSSKGYKDIIGEKSNHNSIWKELMKVDEFKKYFVERFKEIYPKLEDYIVVQIDEAVSLAGKELENEFNIREGWGRYGTSEYKSANTYGEAIEYMKNWTHERLEYLYSGYCD